MGGSDRIRLRDATTVDVALLQRWDRAPHVQRATHDRPVDTYDPESDWETDLEIARTHGPDVWQVLVAELSTPSFEVASVDHTSERWRPIGVVCIIDPYREPTRYWHPVGPHRRAIDIWIGDEQNLGRGYGTEMMTQAIARCFADDTVESILIDPLLSNSRAHRFYQRLGFEVVGERHFGEDHCLVFRLDRSRWQTMSR